MLAPASRLTAALGASAIAVAGLGPGVASASNPSRHGHRARGGQDRHHAGKRGGRVGGGLITGRLSAPGYRIVALGANGRMTSSSSRSFSLREPAPRYTLQLLTRHGVYAGPVVVGGGGRKVIVGLQGAVRLGVIEVDARLGYARPARPVPTAALLRTDWAWARRGVPIGNGRNLGLVISPTRGTGPSGPGGDSDRSGIPNVFDIASGGNGIINSLAPPAPALRHGILATGRVATTGAGSPPATGSTPQGLPPAGSPPATGSTPQGPAPAGSTPSGPPNVSPWMSQLFLPIDQTVNDDAAGVTQAEIDAAVQSHLNIKLIGGVPAGATVELDCNGLSFCSAGGSGQAALEGLPANCTSPQTNYYCTIPFPSGSLDSTTGLGQIVGPDAANGLLGSLAAGGQEFSLFPNATTAQIGSGDVITVDVDKGGATTQTPTTLDFVFNTVPAIASYSDTAGNGTTIAYPDGAGLGTAGNPLPVAAGPNGDVVVAFRVYRPQRAGVAGAGEPSLMDIGHLWYALDHAAPPAAGSTTVGGPKPPECPAADYSALSPTLTLASSSASSGGAGGGAPATGNNLPPGAGGLIDSANDAPAGSEGTIGFTVDISQCLASQGAAFPVGQPIEFDISANSQSSADHANQTFWLERTS